ncbi:unnamed protein product, partial [Ilex paraguariensis]
MAQTVVEFLLEDLKQLLDHSSNSVLAEKDAIETLYEELEFIRSFLCDLQSCNQHEVLANLVARIKDTACDALNYLDYFALSVINGEYKTISGQTNGVFDHFPKLRNFREEIKSIKKEVMVIYMKKLYGVGVSQLGVISTTESFYRGSTTNTVAEDEIVVGFDNEITAMLERLAGDQKQLEVISIVGMAGI